MSKKLSALCVQKRPYIVMTILYGPSIPLLMISIAHNPNDLIIPAIFGIYLLVVGYIFAAFWFYRIELFEDALIDRGLKQIKFAPVKSITKLQMEVGWSDQKWLWAPTLRPFRRMAVYYTIGNQERYIDISLNHFSIEKVRVLLGELIKLRPDLDIPRNFPKLK